MRHKKWFYRNDDLRIDLYVIREIEQLHDIDDHCNLKRVYIYLLV